MLDRLTRPAGQIESQYAALHSRFSASSAYCSIVNRRVDELGETLLATMNQRGDLQLTLQSTVEGLSVAASTYYIVRLVNYLAKGLTASGWPLSAETTAAITISVVALRVWWSIRRLHQRIWVPRRGK